MKEARHLHLIGATGQMRTAVYNGLEHIVVPVVAMVEGVVWASNSQYPEMVLAEELAKFPHQWNGRACFAGHPEDNGSKVTANTPRTLEHSFGVLFNTASEDQIKADKRLVVEAYLDPVKAAAVGEKAADVIRRLKAGETVEVSIGCYASIEQVDGVFNGKPFVGVWRDIVSDHLAFLDDGDRGACSVAAGCGAPRVAIRHLITAEGIRREEPVNEPTPPKRSLKERFALLLAGLRGAATMSDTDLRRALDDALRAIEPGYMGIDNVFPDDSQVIYYVAPEDEWKMMRRSYTLSGGAAKVSDKVEEVEPVTEYQVKAASAAEPKAAACGCGGGHPTSATSTEQETKPMKAHVKTFIDNSGGAFTEADATFLEAIPEEKLALMSSKKAEPAATPAPAAAAPAAPVAAAAKTEAEWLAEAPKPLRDMLARAQRADAERKTTLVSVLKDAQEEYDEAALASQDIESLERLARLLKVNEPVVADFSGRGLPRGAAANNPTTDPRLNPPDPYKPGIEARRAAAAKVN